MTGRTLGVTGVTGFVGQAVLTRALAAGWHVRALVRSPQAPTQGVTWVHGALDSPDALAEMARGCDAVLHIAGVVNAHDAAGFEAGNVAGTRAVVDAARGAGVTRFIHVSSLAAREPQLSHYGQSKARAENIVAASGLDWTMIRPPSIYGPGDRDNLEIFKMAKSGLVMLPPAGRLSLIHVDDLARLLVALVDAGDTHGHVYEVDDGMAGGWSHSGFAKAVGWGVGGRVMTLSLPKVALMIAARADRLVRRRKARLTPDRVNYFCHPDWVVNPARAVPATLWTPEIATRAGLKATAEAYRQAGWL
jgi:uncharacterized protein YbjT (DUF2867 family)